MSTIFVALIYYNNIASKFVWKVKICSYILYMTTGTILSLDLYDRNKVLLMTTQLISVVLVTKVKLHKSFSQHFF